MNRSVAVTAALALALVAALASATVAAAADERRYTVDGSDRFQVGTGDVSGRIAYRGEERVEIAHLRDGTRYRARVDYDRDDQGARARAHASYTAVYAPDGTQRDGENRDPDYLTVLNQPFSFQLDPPTLRDLARLRGPVPFDFPSPMTGGTLRGTLRRVPDALVNGERALGVAFSASGPLRGPLPEHPEMSLAGTISMNGTAFYAYADAVLAALDAKLAIDGSLDDRRARAPVSIVYRRRIRGAAAEGPATARR